MPTMIYALAGQDNCIRFEYPTITVHGYLCFAHILYCANSVHFAQLGFDVLRRVVEFFSFHFYFAAVQLVHCGAQFSPKNFLSDMAMAWVFESFRVFSPSSLC